MAPISWTGLGCYKEDGPAQNQVLSVPLTLNPHPVTVHWTPFLERRPTEVLWLCDRFPAGQPVTSDVTFPHTQTNGPKINFLHELTGMAESRPTSDTAHVFVGRQQEMAVLETALRDAMSPRPTGHAGGRVRV